MSAELKIIARLQDDASRGIHALRGEVEGLGGSGAIAAKGLQSVQAVGVAAIAAVGVAAVAAGAAIASSIGVAADFQDAVTLLAIAAKGAGESFGSMRDAAMAVGADTSLVGVSAAGAAEAMTTLYKAGLTTGEIFGDLNGYLAGNVELSGALRAAIDGAAASELSMAQAADLAAITLATFGSEMKTTEERAAFVNMAMNNYVQAADASMASVADLAAAMQTIGPTAAQFGFSLQDTNTALAILSTRGIKGAEAGTALKSMLNNLMSTTPGTTKALNELGVSIYNADGTMRQLPQIIGDLSQALYGMNESTVMVGGRTAEQNHQLELAQKSYAQATDAIYKHNAGLKTLTDAQLAKYISQQSAANAEIQRLEAITGKATTAISQLTEEQRNQYIATLAGSYGMKAMATLLMEGTEGWTAMEKAIAAAATIQEVARARTETFSGAMEALDGVIETIRIGIGSAFLPVLTALARAFADLAAANLPMIVDSFEAFGGALASFFDAIMDGTPVITAFADSVAGVAEMLGMSAKQAATLQGQIGGFLTAVGNVLGPIMTAITSFVSWKDVLLALGVAIASVVIPVLWGIIQVVAPIVLAFGALVLAIAAVRTAFETNFMGIQTLALNLWGALKTALEGIKALLSGDTATAMTLFRQAWETGWTAVVGFVRNAGSMIGQALAGLWQSVVTWFQGVDWAGLGRGLVEKLLGGMAALGQARADLWAWVITTLTNFINSTNWSQVGYTVVDLLGKAILGAVGLIATAVSGIVTFIWNFITGTDWIELGRNLVNAVIDGLGSFADGAGKKLSEWRDAIFDWAGVEDWGGIAEKIATGVGEKLADFGDRVSTKLGEWQTAIFDWAGKENWQGVAAHIAELVGAALGEAHDSVSADLSTWREAIFDWAGAEDWGGVAQVIVEQVGQWLSDAASTISSTLGSWYDAIVTWVKGVDWGEVGASIVNLVLEGLSTFMDNVGGAISDWWGAFTSAVEKIDWYQIGYDITDFILDGIANVVEFVTDIKDAIMGWYNQFKDVTEGMTWDQIGGLIIAAVVGGLIMLAIDAYNAAADWYAKIETAVNQFIGSFFNLGASIIQGLIDGLKSLDSALDSAIAGVINRVLGGGKDVAESDSPSRLFARELGLPIAQGVALGITQGAGTVIDAIRQVAGEAELAGVKAFADAMKSIGEAIESSIRSYALLSGFSGADTGSSAAGLASMALFMKALVDSFVEANVHAADALDLAGKFADTAGSIVKLITDSLLPLRTLSVIDTSFLLSGRLAAGMSALSAFLVSMVSLFIEASAELGVLGSLVESFIGAAGAVVGLVEDALRAVALLSGFNFDSAVNGWHLRDQIVVLRNIMRTLVREFAEGALELAYMSEAVETFVDAGDAVVGLVEEALHAVMLLSGFNFSAAVQGWHLRDQIIIFRNIVRTMVREFADTSLEFSFMSDSVEAFAEAAGAVFDLVESALHAVMLLSGFNFGAAVQGWHLRDQIIVFRNVVRTMVREFAEAAGEFGSMAVSIEAFADAAEGVIGLVEDGLAAVTALSEFDFATAVSGWHLRDQIVLFRNIIRTLIREFEEAAAEFGSMSGAVESFADAAGAVVELVEDSLAAVTLLSNFDFGPVISGWHLRDQIVLFRNIIRTLMREFADAAVEFGAVAESVESFADAAGAVVDLIEPAIESLNALANYSSDTEALRDGIGRFIDDLIALVVAMAAGFEQAAQDIGTSIENAAEFAGHAGDLVDVVESGVEALAALSNYVSGAGLDTAVETFAADLVTVVRGLVDAFDAAGLLANEAVVEAGEMSGALEDIVKVIEPAVKSVVLLVGYTTVGGLETNVRQFAADLVIVVQTLVDGLESAGMLANAAVAEAGEMAKAIEGILKVVEPALHPDKGALHLITKYISDGGLQGKTQQFIDDLIAVTTILVNGLTESALASGVALQKAGQMAESMKDLFDAMKPALDTINDIASYTSSSNLQQNAQQFVNDLVTIATTLVIGLTAAADSLSAAAVSAAHAFSKSIGLIVAELRVVAVGLSEMGEMSRPDVTPVLKYVTTSAGQISAAFSSEGEIGAAVGYATAFRSNLDQLVTEVRLAVAQLAALAGTGTSGPVTAALGAIAAALLNTAGLFAGAGRVLAETLIAAMVEGIRQGTDAVSMAVISLLGAVLNSATGVAGGFGVAGQTAVRVIQGVLDGGRTALGNSGAMLGESVVSGFMRAMTAGQAGIVRSVSGAMGAAVNAARATLQIASPSAVFGGLADNTVAGYVNGLTKGSAQVWGAVDRMMQGAVDRASGSTLGVGGYAPAGMGGYGGGQPAWAPSVSNGDVNVTIHIDGGNHSLADIRRQVEQAVGDAMRQQGRRADAMVRNR